MTKSIARLMSKLQIDPWRKKVGFSDDIEKAHIELFNETNSESLKIRVINEWLGQYQPCLFGVIAARLGFSSPGSFSTAFRRTTGVSPRDFRQRGARD